MLADWSNDSQMEECDPGASLTVQTSSEETLTTPHMMTLYTNSKVKRTKGNSTLEWTSALEILMSTFEQPRLSHMKPLRRLASRTGIFCLASFLPE